MSGLVSFLNGLAAYVTTSSCSGRIAISSENPAYQKQVLVKFNSSLCN